MSFALDWLFTRRLGRRVPIEPVGGILIQALKRPAVDIERERGRVVAEPQLDRLGMGALGDGEGGCSLPPSKVSA